MRKDHTTGYVRYRVPDHQDPTVLLAALAKQGYEASSVYDRAATMLTITYVGRRAEQRERVRGILGELHDSTLGGPPLIYGPVKFEDEPGEGPHAVPPAEGRRLAEERAASESIAAADNRTAERAPVPTTGLALVGAAGGVALIGGVWHLISRQRRRVEVVPVVVATPTRPWGLHGRHLRSAGEPPELARRAWFRGAATPRSS